MLECTHIVSLQPKIEEETVHECRHVPSHNPNLYFNGFCFCSPNFFYLGHYDMCATVYKNVQKRSGPQMTL